MRSNLLRAAAIYGIANIVAAAVPFLLLPVLTRALPPADYGMVIGFFMLASLSSSIAGLSVHASVSVKWFERHARNFPKFVGAALVLAIASTLFCGLLLLASSFLFSTKLELAPRFWFLAAVQTGATVVVGIRSTLWQSQGLAMRSASLQVASAVLNIGFSLFGVFALALGGAGRIYGAVGASVLSACVATWLLIAADDARWSATKADLSALLRFGVPLIPHALAGSLMVTADRFAVATLLGREPLGIYGTAAQLGMAMTILGDAMVKAASPWMYSQMTSGTARAHLRIVGATYLLIPVWSVVAICLWLLLEGAGAYIVDQRYLPAIDLSFWFLLGGALSAISLNISGLFFFTAKTEWLSLATVASAIVAVTLAPLFAGRFGLVGAAISFVAVQLTSLILTWALSTRVQPMPWGNFSLSLRVLRRTWRPS